MAAIVHTSEPLRGDWAEQARAKDLRFDCGRVQEKWKRNWGIKRFQLGSFAWTTLGFREFTIPRDGLVHWPKKGGSRNVCKSGVAVCRENSRKGENLCTVSTTVLEAMIRSTCAGAQRNPDQTLGRQRKGRTPNY